MPRPDFTKMRGIDQRRRKVEVVSTRPALVAISPRVSFLAGTSDGDHEDRSECEKTTLFLRAGTHVLSRSPGSRDERVLRAPLKATPDSKPRPSPATLAPELSRLLPLAFCPFSLKLPLALVSFPLRICFSLSLFLFRFSLISQNSISDLSHCLSCSIFALHLSPSTSLRSSCS